MPLSASKPREKLHRRVIEIEAFLREDGLYEVEAVLRDTKPFPFYMGPDRPAAPAGEPLHDISVRLAVDETKTIVEFETSMDGTPYSYCLGIEQKFDLTGLKMDGGFMKAVSERVGSSHNCWHVKQMLPQIATVLVQATYPPEREAIFKLPAAERPAPPMLGSCHGWLTNRPHVQLETPRFYKPSEE